MEGGGWGGEGRRPEKSRLVVRRALAEKEGTGPGFPLLFCGHGPTTSPLGPGFPLLCSGKRNGAPWNVFLWKYSELCPGKMQAWPQVPRSSESAATSVPGLLPASERAQSSGHVIKKGGAALGVKMGHQGWLGRGGHTS